jgi:hypothetical protein
MAEVGGRIVADSSPADDATAIGTAIDRDGVNRIPGDIAGAYFRNTAGLWIGLSLAIAPRDAIVPHSFFKMKDSQRSVEQQKKVLTMEVMDKVVVGSTAVVSTSISVGYVIWILRWGSLVTAFVSAMPAWQAFGPLPILQSFNQRIRGRR